MRGRFLYKNHRAISLVRFATRLLAGIVLDRLLSPAENMRVRTNPVFDAVGVVL